jgi:hypothetical protein
LGHGAAAGARLAKSRDPSLQDGQQSTKQHIALSSCFITEHETYFTQKKRASRLWPQKRLVQFADLFNTIFQLVVVLQPFFDQFLLLGPQTDVSNLVTRGSHGQDQNRVAFPARALRTPLLMPNRSLQQRNRAEVRQWAARRLVSPDAEELLSVSPDIVKHESIILVNNNFAKMSKLQWQVGDLPLEFVHFWSRMFRPLDDDKLQEASIQVGL